MLVEHCDHEQRALLTTPQKASDVFERGYTPTVWRFDGHKAQACGYCPSGGGNSQVLLAPEGNLSDAQHPGTLPGQNGGRVEDKTPTVAAHEIMGHGYELMTTAGYSNEGTTRQWENQMRHEQGLEPRQ